MAGLIALAACAPRPGVSPANSALVPYGWFAHETADGLLMQPRDERLLSILLLPPVSVDETDSRSMAKALARRYRPLGTLIELPTLAQVGDTWSARGLVAQKTNELAFATFAFPRADGRLQGVVITMDTRTSGGVPDEYGWIVLQLRSGKQVRLQ